jgi:hypothetical protein
VIYFCRRDAIFGLIACLWLAACASGRADPALATSDGAAHGEDASSRALQVAPHAQAVSPRMAPVDEYGEDIVEARLGSQTLRIARRFFRDWQAPSSDQRFELAILLPDAAPVTREYHSNELKGAAISPITVIHRPGLSASQVFSEWLGPFAAETGSNPEAGDKPRIRGEEIWGLTPLYLDFERLRKQAQARGEKAETVASPHRVYNLDRYIAYGSKGEIVTLIECTARSLDDGVEVVDGALARPRVGNTDTLAVCDHGFVIPGLEATVNVQYPRAYLPDWRRIEKQARDLVVGGASISGNSRP